MAKLSEALRRLVHGETTTDLIVEAPERRAVVKRLEVRVPSNPNAPCGIFFTTPNGPLTENHSILVKAIEERYDERMGERIVAIEWIAP